MTSVVLRSTLVGLLLAACQPGSTPDQGGRGGNVGAGGTVASGGVSGSGGAGRGGSVGAGGTVASGGVSGSGGAPSSGGTAGSGGVPGNGGTAAGSGGTAAGTGGAGADAAPGACTGGSGFDFTTTGIAFDRKSCLAWERGDPMRDVSACAIVARDSNSKLCYSEAVKYCAGLRLDGKSDWRLPTIAELGTLVVAANLPAFDKAVFPMAVASLYWSNEQKAGKVVCLDFSNAGMLNDHIGPDGPQAFRCVRGPVGN